MDVVYVDKLRQRRKEVEMTLRHLERQRREVEENTEWLDPVAYQNRVGLLARVTNWYRKERAQIDRSLHRVTEDRYGLCLGCHEPIEADRLDVYPEAEFCFDCEEYQERLKAG
jgi:RNA polymerase-binding transcription factor DksA